jgi:hypothetical protein
VRPIPWCINKKIKKKDLFFPLLMGHPVLVVHLKQKNNIRKAEKTKEVKA